MAKVEPNQMHRADGVDTPLIVVINGTDYHTKDWSMEGIGVDNFNRDLESNEIIDASIILASKEAKVEMPVTLQFKVKCGSISCFEFAQISEKNKRILHEFLELPVEGKDDKVDGLLSGYNKPMIKTPLKKSMIFGNKEDSAIKKAFAKHRGLYIWLGILFFIILAAIIYYNTAYVYRFIGTISGNFVKISPSVNGKLSKFYVKVGDKVHPNDLLFELDNKMTLGQIEIIDSKLADLRGSNTNTQQANEKNDKLLRLLRSKMNKSYNSYKSAKNLYNRRLISVNDLRRTEDTFSCAKVKYLQEKDTYERTGASVNSKSSMISLKTQLELKREELINTLNYHRIFSNTDGTVYAIKSHEGSYVESGEEIIAIETNEPPFVVCKLKQEESMKIERGMKVKVYAASKDETYSATIKTIGDFSSNTASAISNKVNLKEVTAKIVFDDKNLRLPLNERVKVRFYRSLL